MDYADTNFIVAVHFRTATSDLAEKFIRRQTLPVVVGELVELECRPHWSARQRAVGPVPGPFCR